MTVKPKNLYNRNRYFLCRMGFYETAWIVEGKNAMINNTNRPFDKWFNSYKIFLGG